MVISKLINCFDRRRTFLVPYPVEERPVDNSSPAGRRILRDDALNVLSRVDFSLEKEASLQGLGIGNVLYP